MKNTDEIIANNDNSKKIRKNASSLISKTWGILSFCAWLYFYVCENEACIAVVGIQFFLVLIISLFFDGSKYKNSFSLLSSIGIGVIILLFIFKDSIQFDVDSNKLFFTFIGLLFCAIPLKMFDIIKKDTEKKKSFIPIKATICGYVNNSEGLKGRVFEYTYNDTIYMENDGYYTSRELEPIGTVMDVKIDPKRPNHVVLKDIDFNKIIFPLMYMFLGLGIIMFIIALIV